MEAPYAMKVLEHHINLLRSKDKDKRIESLSFLATVYNTKDGRNLVSISVLLPKVLPLMLDGDLAVRSHVYAFTQAISKEDVEDHVDKMLLYTLAGITHIATDIRNSSLDILKRMLDLEGDALVSCAGGWCKLLKSLMTMQGWILEDTSSAWTSINTSSIEPDGKSKVKAKALLVLAYFLRVGFHDYPSEDQSGASTWGWPLTDTAAHMISPTTNAYGYLNLFGPPRDEEGEIYYDKEDRQKIFQKIFRERMERGLETARQESGEVGRAAADVQKAIKEGMNDFEEAD